MALCPVTGTSFSMTELSSSILSFPFLPFLCFSGMAWCGPYQFPLSLSSQGRLWFPMTHQPAYFMIWVQPHHGSD
jgi:hypothetical protein